MTTPMTISNKLDELLDKVWHENGGYIDELLRQRLKTALATLIHKEVLAGRQEAVEEAVKDLNKRLVSLKKQFNTEPHDNSVVFTYVFDQVRQTGWRYKKSHTEGSDLVSLDRAESESVTNPPPKPPQGKV